MTTKLELRRFNIKRASWKSDQATLSNLRRLVFIIEQNVPQEEEWDGLDDDAWHWLASDEDDRPIGTARLLPTMQIGRMAVLKQYRGLRIGTALLEQAVEKARYLGFESVFLNAQTHALAFYNKSGFKPEGEEFLEAGIPHYRMVKQLSPTQGGGLGKVGPGQGDPYLSSADPVYKLGVDERFLLLKREAEFQRVIVEMCQQATHSIRILSPFLDHKLFDSSELMEICSRLARKNRYTRIEILLYDSHRIIKNGHVLLEISRKLSSSIKIKIVHPELRATNQEFVLVDGVGVIYRQDIDHHEGYANFRDITENNRLGRQFQSSWESGLYDSNLRQLNI